jgi:Viral BACON domain/Kelch motif
VLSDGRVFDCGGTLADGLTPVNTAETYDPSSGTWSTTGSMGFSRVGHIAVRLADGRVLVAGGKSSTILSSAEVFDPVAGSWAPTSPMAEARWGANALLVGDSCSVVTTQVGLTVNATVQCTGDFVLNNQSQQILIHWNDPNGSTFGTGPGGGTDCGATANTCILPAPSQNAPNNTYPSGGTSTFTIKVDVTDASGNTTSVFKTVNIGPITVAVSPNPASVLAGNTQQFSATVMNATDMSVTWSVTSGGGKIDSTGLYTAPLTAPTSGGITITATSVADGTKGQATVTVTDFGATLSSTSANVAQGASANVNTTVTVTSENGFAGRVNLSCPGIPSGLNCAFNPSALTVSAGGSPTSTLTISTSANTPANTYTVIVAATDALTGATRDTTLPFTLQVVPQTGCNVVLKPTSQSFTAVASTGSITVTSSCEGWTATSNVDWITVTSGGSGSGNGSVAFSVAANTTTTQRTGTLTVAGLTFTVTQSGEVAVTVAPNPAPTVQAGTTQQFVATVINTATTGVTWSVTGIGCNGLPCGTIDQNGCTQRLRRPRLKLPRWILSPPHLWRTRPHPRQFKSRYFRHLPLRPYHLRRQSLPAGPLPTRQLRSPQTPAIPRSPQTSLAVDCPMA